MKRVSSMIAAVSLLLAEATPRTRWRFPRPGQPVVVRRPHQLAEGLVGHLCEVSLARRGAIGADH